MADCTLITEAYVPLKGLDGGRLMMHCGNADMGAATDAELPTKLIEILMAKLTPGSYDDGAIVGGNVMFTDRVVTSKKVTIERKVDAGGDTFSFILIGRVT